LKAGPGSPKLRAVRNHELLSPEEVLARFTGGPKEGVFTDGSCEGNPGPGGWGFVWVEDDRIVVEKSGVDPATTNNRMELTALIEAYRVLPEDAEVVVHSDSQLCVKTINEWAAGWERRGWKRKTGPIANLEMVQKLWDLSRRHPKVRLEWIRAHDGSRWNEYVDALAAAYMRR
jgi:ribonuclease HI